MKTACEATCEHVLGAILDAMPERVIRYKVPDLTILYCNVAWAAGHRLAPSGVIGRNLAELLTASQIAVLRQHLEVLTPDNLIISNGTHTPNDTDEWIHWVDRFLPDADGSGDQVVAVGRDESSRHLAELQLLESEAQFRELADKSADIVWRLRVDPTPRFDYVSPVVEQILGYSPESLLADFTLFLDILVDDSRDVVVRALAAGLPLDRTDLRFRSAHGEIVIGETLTALIPGGLQGISRDVTELRGLQDSLTSLALRDPLTGLANRRLLEELLEQALARARSSGHGLSVLFLDLDSLKAVNDTYGHDAGDIVLRETARRLMGVVRSGETVARLGGDEFVIVCESDRAGAERLVARIHAVLREPIVVGAAGSVRCPASIGVADTARAGVVAGDLIAAADAAMYERKRARRRSTPC